MTNIFAQIPEKVMEADSKITDSMSPSDFIITYVWEGPPDGVCAIAVASTQRNLKLWEQVSNALGLKLEALHPDHKLAYYRRTPPALACFSIPIQQAVDPKIFAMTVELAQQLAKRSISELEQLLTRADLDPMTRSVVQNEIDGRRKETQNANTNQRTDH